MPDLHMCKTKMAINASDPNSLQTRPTPSTPSSRNPRNRPSKTASAPAQVRSPKPANSGATSSGNYTASPSSSGGTYAYGSSGASASITTSRSSLSSLRDSLPENPLIYDFSEIRTATNNFLAKRYSPSSSTPCWRCTLRGKETIVFQRKFRRKIDMRELKERLSVICRSHHAAVIRLIGASISGEHIYLVYEFARGASLAEILRNPKNPSFTVLSTWVSRMQIATDLSHGLDYIHNNTGLNISLVHNHIKSTSIIVTEPSLNAKICHFGASYLCGDAVEDNVDQKSAPDSEIMEEESRKVNRTGGGSMRFEGARGYMSSEFRSSGVATWKTDVFAFGVVILELLSGEEPLKYRFDKDRGDFIRTSVIETARWVIEGGDEEGREWRLRRWVDRRLGDSFPVEVAEKVTRLALDCVHVDSDKRPKMGRVAGKISKFYLESKIWQDSMKISKDISVSLAPR